MRALLLSVFLLGCGGAAPLGSTSQALPGPTPVGKLGGYQCLCSTSGKLTEGLICVGGTWDCAPNDGVDCGWEPQCNGAGSGSVASDYDVTGEACSGNTYSGFPDTCPQLTNTKADGKYYCFAQ